MLFIIYIKYQNFNFNIIIFLFDSFLFAVTSCKKNDNHMRGKVKQLKVEEKTRGERPKNTSKGKVTKDLKRLEIDKVLAKDKKA